MFRKARLTDYLEGYGIVNRDSRVSNKQRIEQINLGQKKVQGHRGFLYRLLSKFSGLLYGFVYSSPLARNCSVAFPPVDLGWRTSRSSVLSPRIILSSWFTTSGGVAGGVVGGLVAVGCFGGGLDCGS